MTASAFWRFSLAFYAVPRVAPTCIALQDEAGVDVNVLLFMLFIAHEGRALDAAAVARIMAVAQPWTAAAVTPLRAVRRNLRQSIGVFDTGRTADLRTEVKRSELAAERLLQDTLHAEFPCLSLGIKSPDRGVAAAINLRTYAAALGLADAVVEPLLQRYLASLAGAVPK